MTSPLGPSSPPKIEPFARRGLISAILAAGLILAAFVLTNIPGNPVVGPQVVDNGKYGPHFECYERAMVHGWPFTYLEHDGDYSATQPGRPRHSAWRIGDSPIFAAGPLTANIVIWLVAAGVSFWLVRGRVSRHGWQFGLSHLLIVVCTLSVCGAYLSNRLRLHRAQVRFLQQHPNNPHFDEWQPFGPHWLRSITGPSSWEWGDHLVAVHIVEAEDIRELPGKGSVKVLRFAPGPWPDMPDLDEFDSLIAVDLFMSNSSKPGVAEHCLRAVARCKSIEGLNLYDTGVTDRALQELRPLQNLANLELAANEEITDEGLEHLKSLKSLKRLSLGRRSGITQAGVDKLQAALPDCEIEW